MQCAILNCRKLLLTLIIGIRCLPTYAQQANDLRRDADTVRLLLSKADTLVTLTYDMPNAGDTLAMINKSIGQRLVRMLQNPAITKNKPDILLADPALGITHSDDNRLWIFSWKEYTEGCCRNLNVVHYRTLANEPRAECSGLAAGNKQRGDFYANGVSFYKIYKLGLTKHSLYLCIGRRISGNGSENEIASVLELTADSINYNYPAFFSFGEALYGIDRKYIPSLMIRAYSNDIKEFSFNPKTQRLRVVRNYSNPSDSRDKGKRLLVNELTFDGRHFH